MRAPSLIAAGVVTFVMTAGSASAVTVDQILALHKAGVSDAVILALLDRDLTVLTIEPDQLVTLKREGLSDSLITAMLKNGRAEGEQAAQAVSAANAAAVLSALDSAPGVYVVGHGPDRPNTAHTEDYYRGFRDGVRLPPPSAVGPLYPLNSRGYRRSFADRTFVLPSAAAPLAPARPAPSRALCIAQVNTPTGIGPRYVTECPGR